ncbi:POK19 protein, partial [Pteruthius melanotis]|nr:POK19 protein [Pteruthius melanotis]
SHTCQHLLRAFASLGVPQEIKTDNGPAYTAQKLATFLMCWGVRHTFSIPYSPTSQAIVEKTHHS